ncbi:MAG: DUF2798 domain-containing protein [Gammaproteobacteria bacterium]|nr:DUF2798 domain-containing protein [Gammaproteobacteria bacterium]
MIKRKYLPLVNSLLMSLVMVLIMTGVITAVNTGFSTGYLHRWATAALIAWPVAFTVILLVGKRVAALANRICSA